MPTLSYPAPVSRGLGGFSEGFLGGLALLRQFRDAEERQRRQGIEEPYLLARTAALEGETRRRTAALKEEARRRADSDRVMTEVFRPNQDEAERLIQQGTPEALEQAHLRRSRAWRALAPTLTEAHRLTAERNAEEYLQKAASVRQDRAEGAREARDAQRLAKAYQAVQANPDSTDAVAAVVDVVTKAESTRGRQDNAKLVQGRFEALLKRTEESEPVRDLMSAVQVGLTAHPGDARKAWDAAFKAKPEAFLKAASHAMAQGKAPAEPVAKRLFGPEAPKDRMQAAHLVAVNAGPVGSRAYMQALKGTYADLGAPDDAPKLRDVLTRLRGQEESTFRTLLLRLDSVRGSPQESLVQQEMQAAQANMRALDAELRRIGIPLAPPKAQRATEGADPKRALLPPAAATRKDALAEKQRLLGLGHTPESARAAMRTAGWFIVEP